jgi:vacuolar protein sorting-associated protein 13D
MCTRRDRDRRMHFLRVEIVLQDATYFIIFTDAETMPPPLRIDNFTQIDLDFHQVCCIGLRFSRSLAPLLIHCFLY